jgi:hypothetical protein
MAHRESVRSAAIEIRSGRPADAARIVTAAAALAATRTLVPSLITAETQKFGGYSEAP